MSTKIRSFILIGILTIGSMLFPGNSIITSANENTYFNEEDNKLISVGDESIGYAQIMPRGMYLQGGYSRISKTGEGQITAGGATLAQMVVDEISIAVEVQKMDGGDWETVEMWSVEEKKESVILTSKTIKVKPGLYRVACLHSANADASSSFSDALFID